MVRVPPVVTRLGVALALGIGAFLVATVLPVPRDHEPREELARQVSERFPGWAMMNLTEAQENSWVVAVRCGSDVVGFRLLRDFRPVGGAPWGDFWVSPDNRVSRARLSEVTEVIGDWLLWRARPAEPRRLPCSVSAATSGS